MILTQRFGIPVARILMEDIILDKLRLKRMINLFYRQEKSLEQTAMEHAILYNVASVTDNVPDIYQGIN